MATVPVAPAEAKRAQFQPDRLFAHALDHHNASECAAASAPHSELLVAHLNNPDVLHNLGLVLRQLGRMEEALTRLDTAIAAAPERISFQASRAALLINAGRYAEAAERYARLDGALDAKSMHNRAVALARLGRTAEALDICERLFEVNAADAGTHGLKGNLLTDSGDYRAARSAYREALRRRPGDFAAISNLLLMLKYSDAVSADELMQAHREWGARIDGAWPALPANHGNSRSTARPLRLGLLSPDFGDHPVGYLVLPWLRHLDPASFDLCLYSTRRRNDALSQRLQGMAAQWRECQGMTDVELAAQTRRDQIDILVDLANHTAGNRLGSFARGPAPVQVSYLGYPTTTGLASVGFRLTDPTVNPVGNEGTEQPVQLQGGMFRYEPPAQAPEPATPPAAKTGHISFGCFCNL